jgi:hypothetical protein
MICIPEINLETLSDNEVLFFIRIRGKNSYFKNVYSHSFLSLFRSIKKFRTISEYAKDADVYIDITNTTYYSLTTADRDFLSQYLPFDEITKRCRGLRNIPQNESKELIYRCGKFFIDLYQNNKIKLIVSGCVDNYVMDIMHRLASYYNIKSLGITDSFLYPHYKLLTVFGKRNEFYTPTEKELQSIYEKLSVGTKSKLAISFWPSIRQAHWNLFSFIYRYFVRYLWKYKIRGKTNYEYRFAPFLKGFNNPALLLGWFYFDKINLDSVKLNPEKYVYIPLHFVPEASIDYWVDDCNNADYYCNLFDILKFFEEKEVTVILKEHPALFPGRPLDAYKQMKKFSNVLILHPFFETQKVLSSVENIVVWTGSTGIEAIMRDKKVYVATENYYSDKKLNSYKQFGSARVFSQDEKLELIQKLLSTSFPVGDMNRVF